MSAHDFFLILHLLLFCYWLGGDLGVFYSSGMVIDPKLSNKARLTAAKIMVNLDLVPRICMSLMLTVGGLLSEYKGVEHPTWQLVGIIALGPVWLAMVLAVHVKEGTDFGRSLARVDYWFRWALVTYLVASSGYSIITGDLGGQTWVAWKLLVFAGLVFCGLMIRQWIGPYVAGIHALATDTVTDQSNRGMADSLNKLRPFVLAIWGGILIEVWLGVVEPGDSGSAAEVLGSLGRVFGGG